MEKDFTQIKKRFKQKTKMTTTNNTNIATKTPPTWCPGCFNYQILLGVKNFLKKEIEGGKKKSDFAIATGIGCHAKIFDYLDLNGLNTLHGRVLPTCLGMKLGNPNLNVIGFSGDGDAFAEGMEHTIHAARNNADFTYVVHNNQVFALTVGQPTPVTEKGFSDKTTPQGVKVHPLNPLQLMLSAGATFVARVFADSKEVEWIMNEAQKHKGFSFVEIIQPCVIFHDDIGYKEKMYSLEKSGHDKTSFEKAFKKAGEFDYDAIKKIPVGIFYQTKRDVFENQFSQIKELKKKKISFRDLKR